MRAFSLMNPPFSRGREGETYSSSHETDPLIQLSWNIPFNYRKCWDETRYIHSLLFHYASKPLAFPVLGWRAIYSNYNSRNYMNTDPINSWNRLYSTYEYVSNFLLQILKKRRFFISYKEFLKSEVLYFFHEGQPSKVRRFILPCHFLRFHMWLGCPSKIISIRNNRNWNRN